MPDAASPTDARAIARLADACVRCGACLPVCPTYAATRHQGDSPRGRIELVEALLAGRLAADPPLSAHIEGCLHCRACERVCPARVEVTAVIAAGRDALRAEGLAMGWRVRLARERARFGWVLARFRAALLGPRRA